MEQLTQIENVLQLRYNATDKNISSLVRNAYVEATNASKSATKSMVGFGLVAISARSIVGHGKFGAWLEDTLGGKLCRSTAYRYIKCAEYFVAKMLDAQGGTDYLSAKICEFAELFAIKTDDIQSILNNAMLTNSLLDFVIEDMPFATFLNILKTANANALALEMAESNLPAPQTPAQQLAFFDSLFDELRATVEVKREDPKFLEMSKDELAEVGNYLLKQGREILEIAKNK